MTAIPNARALDVGIREAILPAKEDGHRWQVVLGPVSADTGLVRVLLMVEDGKHMADQYVPLDPLAVDYGRVTEAAFELRNAVWSAGLSASPDEDDVRERSYAIANAIDSGAAIIPTQVVEP